MSRAFREGTHREAGTAGHMIPLRPGPHEGPVRAARFRPQSSPNKASRGEKLRLPVSKFPTNVFNEWQKKFSDRIVDLRGRLKGGKVVTSEGALDGPFVETKEVIGVYMIVSAESLEEACRSPAPVPAWSARVPAWRFERSGTRDARRADRKLLPARIWQGGRPAVPPRRARTHLDNGRAPVRKWAARRSGHLPAPPE